MKIQKKELFSFSNEPAHCTGSTCEKMKRGRYLKKILFILITACMLVCIAIPTVVQAANVTDTVHQLKGTPEETPTIRNSGDISDNETPRPATLSDRNDGRKDAGAFKITTDKTTKITEKKQEDEKTGTLRIVKLAAGTGARLSGATFAVYAVDNNQEVANPITTVDGVVELNLPVGNYYLKEQRAPKGFRLETARILFTITANQTTKVEVTNEKEGAPAPSTSQKSRTSSETVQVTTPKNEKTFPVLQYTLTALLLVASSAINAN